MNQKINKIEIICVNDGSTDDSLLILLNYSKKDNRIIIEQRNIGLSKARNIGVKYSNGKFIYFIDNDDLLIPNALFELYEYEQNIIWMLYILNFLNLKIKLISKIKILINLVIL